MKAVTKLFGLAAAGALFAGAVEAQMPSYEFGVDLGIVSSKFDGADYRLLTIGAPLDVRIGFVASGALSFEPRFSLLHVSSDGGSATSFNPSVNVLYRLGVGTGLHNQMGPYLTGGVGLNYSRFSDDDADESESDTQLGFNVGIGTRLGWGNAAFRPELFFGMGMESGDEGTADFTPSVTMFGVRVGVSVWR